MATRLYTRRAAVSAASLRTRCGRPVIDDLVVAAANDVIDAEGTRFIALAVHREKLRQLARTLDITALAELDARVIDLELALFLDLRELATHRFAAAHLVLGHDRDRPRGDAEHEHRRRCHHDRA